MPIAIGADHGGFEIKGKLADSLKKQGHEVKPDFDTCDYISTPFSSETPINFSKTWVHKYEAITPGDLSFLHEVTLSLTPLY